MSYDHDDGRHFDNTFSDYSPDCSEITDNQISSELITKIETVIQKLAENLVQSLKEMDDSNDSMYTGVAGVAHTLHFLAEHETHAKQKEKWKTTNAKLLKKFAHSSDGRKPSFLCGDAGPLLALLKAGLGDADKVVDRLLRVQSRALRDETPDEVLNGRAGYLYALLELRRYNIRLADVDATISRIVTKMIQSGIALSKAMKMKNPPLMYAWHDSYYLGAAHGMTGIMYLLLQVPSNLMEADVLESLIRPTIDWLMSLRFRSGNFPSSWKREGVVDKLVHWCHGAPGWIYMFARAYEVFKDERYLAQAKVCGEVIWRRGLLRKGYGLCHGVAGNGYAFLLLNRLTGDQKYLYRTVKFAEFCCNYGAHGCRQPDRPLSLYEGMAGTIYFLKDILNPQNARFPGFEV